MSVSPITFGKVKSPCGDCWDGVCTMNCSGREIVEEKREQQLVARIKRSSKYWGQTAPNEWFDVRVVTDTYYQLRGNQNNYRFSDVVMGIRVGDTIMDFKTGQSSK
jgi:hypothetical protein